MELDEMKSAWMTLNQRTDQHAKWIADLEREVRLEKARSLVRRTHRAPTWDIVFGLATAGLTGTFIGHHWPSILAEPLGAMPALALHLFALASIGLGVRQWALLGSLDLTAPLMDAQRTIEHVRAARIRGTQWMFVAALPLWMIFPIFFAQWLFGFEIYQALSAPWVVANVLFGLFAIGVGAVIARRAKGSSWIRRLSDTIAGAELVAIRASLEQLETFGREAANASGHPGA